MKKLTPVFIILVLLFPLSSHAQEANIFADFVWTHENDISIYWVLTDPNGRKYKGGCDVALGTDPNVYL